jgi:hypothetical protein
MATAWAALGALMGASVGLESGGLVGGVAAMLAGALELAGLGVIFALLGGTPRESLLGAVLGLAAGLAAGLAGAGAPAPVVLVANFGMVVGAIAGATLRPYLRLLSLPILLVGRILYRPRPQPAAARTPSRRSPGRLEALGAAGAHFGSSRGTPETRTRITSSIAGHFRLGK